MRPATASRPSMNGGGYSVYRFPRPRFHGSDRRPPFARYDWIGVAPALPCSPSRSHSVIPREASAWLSLPWPHAPALHLSSAKCSQRGHGRRVRGRSRTCPAPLHTKKGVPSPIMACPHPRLVSHRRATTPRSSNAQGQNESDLRNRHALAIPSTAWPSRPELPPQFGQGQPRFGTESIGGGGD